MGYSSLSKIESGKYEAYISDFGLGLKFQDYVASRNVLPFVESGISIVSSEIEYPNIGGDNRFEDWDLGYWMGIGVDYMISDQWTLGMVTRYVVSEVEIAGENKKLGGLGWGITFGYVFR